MDEELTTYFKIEKEIMETQEEFMYTSIYPFCEQVVEHRLSKKELEEILRKGMKYDELLVRIKQAKVEMKNVLIEETTIVGEGVKYYSQMGEGIATCLDIIGDVIAESGV